MLRSGFQIFVRYEIQKVKKKPTGNQTYRHSHIYDLMNRDAEPLKNFRVGQLKTNAINWYQSGSFLNLSGCEISKRGEELSSSTRPPISVTASSNYSLNITSEPISWQEKKNV